MLRFAALYQTIDQTTKTTEKLGAMVNYFQTAAPADAAWATYFLCGHKPRQLVPTKLLRQWAAEAAGIPAWLFDEAYHNVGDLAETLSLIVPAPAAWPRTDAETAIENPSDSPLALSVWVEDRLLPLRRLEPDDQRQAVELIWRQTDTQVRFVVMKLITGAFRVGVSKRLVTRALAQFAGLSPELVAHRLMGDWQPSASLFEQWVDPADQQVLISQPYPFCLAHAVDPSGPEALGDCQHYAAEWKWDGIRGQLVHRRGETYLWSRGEELMERRWPELEQAADWLPDGTVLDGEILATNEAGVLPFATLQRRIGRKQLSKKLLKEVPVVFHAFDLLEIDGTDIRTWNYDRRRQRLEQLFGGVDCPSALRVTELLPAQAWCEWEALRGISRQRSAEGLMLKLRSAPYDVGRVRGTWWKWKIAPYTIDAVLIYAQKGHGKRASLFTDYTFALWQGEELVPFAKAYSGLDDAEIRQVDRFVRQNTRDTFGPVRSVAPQLVMELAFEGLQHSPRHKSGIATRFPRIIRWRHDKRPEDANTLEELKALLTDAGSETL